MTGTLSPHPGFGIPTITATRILKGQQQGKLGPETPLAVDAFPYVALSKVSPCHAGHGARVMPVGLPAQKHPRDAHTGCTGSLPIPHLSLGKQMSMARGVGGGVHLTGCLCQPLPALSLPRVLGRRTTWTGRSPTARGRPQPTSAG